MNIQTAINRENLYKPRYNERQTHNFNSPKNNINFTGVSVTKIINNGQTAYPSAEKIINGIDNILGEKYFQNKIAQAGFKLNDAGELLVKNRTLLGDIGRTIRFPLDLVANISHKVLKTTSKIGPFKKGSEAILNGNNVLKRHIDRMETEKASDYVNEVLDVFTGKHKTFDVDNCIEAFKDNATSNVGKILKNYRSRDERVLNRIATALVSALYSANDFYNISMLQKDDKNEAKKAHKGRFKQEVARMGISATTTFISLGILERYTKSNLMLNAAVIAGSALLSEVGSRLISKTPLVPLTPEQAAKIAAKKAKSKETGVKNNNQTNSKEKNSFKGNIKDDKNLQALYKDFANSNGTLDSLNIMQDNLNSKNAPKKKMSLSQKVGLASLVASGIFILSSIAKGEFKFNKEKIAFCAKHDLTNLDTNGEIFKEGKELIDKYNKRSDKVSFLANLKKVLTSRKKEIDLSVLQNKLNKMKEDGDCKAFEGLIDKYLDHIQTTIEKNNNSTIIKVKKENKIASGVVNGATKIFSTVYSILSIPGFMVKKALIREPQEFKAVSKLAKETSKSRYNKELGELYNICINKNNKAPKSNKEILDTIKKRVRNIETGPETGDLAHYSRTMVTGISTYFFVNDYTNKVLIESGGKNVEEAKEERNERIAHKVSNFVINGTLMNIFNTVFKKPLNNSLLGATLVAAATETTNEFLVRKSICQPITKKESKQAIIDYEEEQMNKKGIMGAWSRTFKKITGKKSLTQKAKIDTKKDTNK